MSETTRRLARCGGFEVGIEDHGMLFMFGAFDYDGSGQGFGYAIDGEFIKRFLRVFRVEKVKQVNDRYCWVTHTNDRILKVEPPLASDGEAFDVEAWANSRPKRLNRKVR